MLGCRIQRALRHYRVSKTITEEGPLPAMIKYSLQSDDWKPLSFWNDIELGLRGDTVTCVVEVPKEKHGKFEVKKHIPHHPIMQDTRNNLFTKQPELRFYAQFPLFNYGFIPQTWQQNLHRDAQGLFGDDDPIDICDLSEQPKPVGQPFRARVLGGFCLIDQGETDWKLLMIEEQESLTKKISCLEDVDPRHIQSIKKWFKVVKVYDGKKPNSIAYDEKVFGKSETLQIIQHTHAEWRKLMASQDPQYDPVRAKHQITRREMSL